MGSCRYGISCKGNVIVCIYFLRALYPVNQSTLAFNSQSNPKYTPIIDTDDLHSPAYVISGAANASVSMVEVRGVAPLSYAAFSLYQQLIIYLYFIGRIKSSYFMLPREVFFLLYPIYLLDRMHH